jgi:UDP-glucuronate 4-epimerase
MSRLLAKAIGKKAVLDLLPMQKDDVPATRADVSALEQAVQYGPNVVGIPRFVEW